MKPRAASRFPLVVVLATVAALGLLGATPTAAQTVTTDQSDYSPGSTVIITGTGWLANEPISMVLTEYPQVEGPLFLASTADANGDFTNSQFVVQPNDIGITFTLTATGQVSGRVAEAGFLDSGIAPGSLASPVGSLPQTGLPFNKTHWRVQAGDTIMGTITGATDAVSSPCAVNGVNVYVKSSSFGNTAICGTLSGTTITFTWVVPPQACSTTIVAYNSLGNNANNALLPGGNGSSAAGYAIVDGSGNVVSCGATTTTLPPTTTTTTSTATTSTATTTTATTTTATNSSTTATTATTSSSTTATTVLATTTTSATTATSTSTTSEPPVQCCVPGSAGGAFLCEVETATQCAAQGGLNEGPGTCAPNPCVSITTSSTTTSTTPSTSPTPTTVTTTSSTTATTASSTTTTTTSSTAPSTTTITTSTTTTTVPACVPTGPEAGHCNDGIDNDCNGLIDCDDPACQPAICFGGSNDDQGCATQASQLACMNGGGVCQCPSIDKDPTSVRLNPRNPALSRFHSHGRVLMQGHPPIESSPVSWLLSNNQGKIFEAGLPAGTLTANSSGTLFNYQNPSAKTAGGVYRVRLQYVAGSTSSLRYTVDAYGDLSRATSPNMSVQLYVANLPTPAIHTQTWKQTRGGWITGVK